MKCSNGQRWHTWSWWQYSEVAAKYFRTCERMGCAAEQSARYLVPKKPRKRRR